MSVPSHPSMPLWCASYEISKNELFPDSTTDPCILSLKFINSAGVGVAIPFVSLELAGAGAIALSDWFPAGAEVALEVAAPEPVAESGIAVELLPWPTESDCPEDVEPSFPFNVEGAGAGISEEFELAAGGEALLLEALLESLLSPWLAITAIPMITRMTIPTALPRPDPLRLDEYPALPPPPRDE
jgi:hypothetical protein